MLKLSLFSERKLDPNFYCTRKGVRFDPIVQRYCSLQIREEFLRPFLHVSLSLFLRTKKGTTKVKTKAGRYA